MNHLSFVSNGVLIDQITFNL
ncbi:hypothetical protein BCAR13_630026 [Paraburkholderia caribensis]|nr:hypothetical protein BCAR13_630026 [Paraburkholderia caribensis]